MLVVPCVAVGNSCTVCNASDLIAIVPPNNKVGNILFSTIQTIYFHYKQRKIYSPCHDACILGCVVTQPPIRLAYVCLVLMLGYTNMNDQNTKHEIQLTIVIHLNNVTLPSLALENDRRVG